MAMDYELAGPPPMPDYDQHYLTGRQSVRWLPSYEYDERGGRIEISDPVWGDETIGDWPGDEIFGELFLHPVFQRLDAVEQLTLPERYATMPGSTGLTRWEHLWGSVVLARKLIREAEDEGRTFDPREKQLLQLRTLVSDAAQYAFSHLGDWLKQGFGGTEDSHDDGLQEYLELTGVNDILRRHGVQPEEVIFPDECDWVECPSPDLCLDRVDYGAREMDRWVTPGMSNTWRDAFYLDDSNRLVMRNRSLARQFGAGFGLLATEHWSHPVHRLQLQLFGELIKSAILAEPRLMRGNLHPTDVMYTTDDDLLAVTRQVGPLNNNLHALMLDIARAQRRIFTWGREHEVMDFMNQVRYGNEDAVFPHPLESTLWQSQYAGVHSQNVEFVPVEQLSDLSDFGRQEHTYDVYLPRLKARSVDPLFRGTDGTVRRLSESDDQYRAMLERSRSLQAQAYVARIHMVPAAVEALADSVGQVQGEWELAMAQPRTEMSAQALKENMRWIGMSAVGRSVNRIRYHHA